MKLTTFAVYHSKRIWRQTEFFQNISFGSWQIALKRVYYLGKKGKGVFELQALSVFASFFVNNWIAYKGNGVFNVYALKHHCLFLFSKSLLKSGGT